MTDEEKAEEYVNNVIKDYGEYFTENEIFSMITCYKDGLAEGRKEGYEQGKNNERELQCGRKNYEKDIAELEKENAELKEQIEGLQVDTYSELCEQRKIIHRNLIEAFSEQLGILDKDEDELFSLKAIKSVISNILEIEK